MAEILHLVLNRSSFEVTKLIVLKVFTQFQIHVNITKVENELLKMLKITIPIPILNQIHIKHLKITKKKPIFQLDKNQG